MANHQQAVTLPAFAGINNKDVTAMLKPGELTECENYLVADVNMLVSRPGQEVLIPGAAHSLWSDDETCFFRQGENLVQILSISPLTTKVIRTGLQNTNHMRFVSLHGTVYYTDGQYNGVIEAGTGRYWGIDIPVGFSQTPVDGGLKAGKYQIAMTFRYGGQESGATMPVTITVGADSGILIANIPNISNTNADAVSIYMSGCNGTELYYLVSLPFGVRQFTIASSDTLGHQLPTQFLYPPPAGSLLAFFGGRIYVADSNVLYYSQPFGFDLFHQNSFLQFPARITAIMPMSQGMYIGTKEKVYHLIGLSPEPQPMQVLEVFPYGIVEGTETLVSMKHLGGETIWTWMSTHGVCTGNDQGLVANITESRYSVQSANVGSGMILDWQGFISYIACLSNQDVPEYSVYKRDGIGQVTLPALQTILF